MAFRTTDNPGLPPHLKRNLEEKKNHTSAKTLYPDKAAFTGSGYLTWYLQGHHLAYYTDIFVLIAEGKFPQGEYQEVSFCIFPLLSLENIFISGKQRKAMTIFKYNNRIAFSKDLYNNISDSFIKVFVFYPETPTKLS